MSGHGLTAPHSILADEDIPDFSSGPAALIADWVLPVSSPPIINGAVVIDDGRIVFVGEASAIEHGVFPTRRVYRFRDAILTPGLVNTHSHLELTSLRGYLEALDFRSWLRVLTRVRRDLLRPEDILTASLAGVREGMLSGISTFGDASATGIPLRAMCLSGARGVVYLEVFGPDPAMCDLSMRELKDGIDRLRSESDARVVAGVSPHAPYTISPVLFGAVAHYAVSEGLPVSVHIAESAEEVDYVRYSRGPFAEGLKARGIAALPPHRSPVELLRVSGLLEARPLLVHAIHIDEADAALMAESGSTVSHCPISNARLGHGMAPAGMLLRSGIPMGLGSDSVASNNRMDILAEARQASLIAAVHPGYPTTLSAHDVLALATLGGARALGLDRDIGSLEVGKAADIAIFDAEGDVYGPVFDPAVTLVHTLAGGARVRLLLIDGVTRVREGEHTAGDPHALRAEMREIGERLKAWHP